LRRSSKFDRTTNVKVRCRCRELRAPHTQLRDSVCTPQVHLHAFSKRGASHDAAMLKIKLAAAAASSLVDDPLWLCLCFVLIAVGILVLCAVNPAYYNRQSNALRTALGASFLVASSLGCVSVLAATATAFSLLAAGSCFPCSTISQAASSSRSCTCCPCR